MRLKYFIYLILLSVSLGFAISLYYLIVIKSHTEIDLLLRELTQISEQEVQTGYEELTYSYYSGGASFTCGL